jgi:hypothetical protein
MISIRQGGARSNNPNFSRFFKEKPKTMKLIKKTKVGADSEPPLEEVRMCGQVRRIISAVLLLGIGLTGFLTQMVKEIEGNVCKTIRITISK